MIYLDKLFESDKLYFDEKIIGIINCIYERDSYSCIVYPPRDDRYYTRFGFSKWGSFELTNDLIKKII